jgi:hypothetical protein
MSSRNWDHLQQHMECTIYPEKDEELGRPTVGHKFGEFILPPRTSKINIMQAIERLFTSVSRRRRAHLCSYGGKS